MYKLVIMIAFLAVSNLYSADLTFTEVTSNSIKANISGNNSKIFIVARKEATKPLAPTKSTYETGSSFSDFKPAQMTGDGNLVVYKGSDKSGNFSISGLSAETVYSFDIYKESSQTPEKTINKVTLAQEPAQQAKGIAFANIKKNSMKVVFSKGDGKRHIILAREGKEPELPKDAIELKANAIYGIGDKIGEDTYVVSFTEEGKDQNTADISGLNPGTKYFITVLEANGKGETLNINTILGKGNKSSKITPPEAPKALKTDDAKNASFTAKWEAVKGAVSYELDVATDNEFKNIVPDYKAVDVGLINSILVEELPKADAYYYRLRAVGEGGLSDESNIVEVEND